MAKLSSWSILFMLATLMHVMTLQGIRVASRDATADLWREVTGSSHVDMPASLAARLLSPLSAAQAMDYRQRLAGNMLPDGFCEAAGVACHTGNSAFVHVSGPMMEHPRLKAHSRHMGSTSGSITFTPTFMKDARAAGAYFRERDLTVGSTVDINYGLTNPVMPRPMLPAELASFFSLDQPLEQITKVLGVPAGSPLYREMAATLEIDCKISGNNEDNKHCVTSLEDMLQWAKMSAQAPLKMMSSSLPPAFSLPQMATFTHIELLAPETTPILGCHGLPFPFALYACHQVPHTKAYKATWIDSTTQAQVDALATCHMDTSAFDPNHVAFAILNMKPGEGEICHWVAEGNPIFFPANNM